MPALQRVQVAYWVALMVAVALSMGLRRWTAVRALRRHGASPVTGLFTVRVYAEMRAYRALCEREGLSLVWWRAWWALHVALWLGLAGWLALVAFSATR